MNYIASEAEENALEARYSGRKCYHGELHDHSDSGGTSDGSCTLTEWKETLQKLHMDFAAILDHRQVRHMFLPEFDKSLFVCGSEPGTLILDSHATKNELHYNMLVPDPETLMAILDDIPEYRFEGGIEGHFTYPFFDRKRFGEVIDTVLAHDGFFVIPHPKQIMESAYDEDYWYRDYIGMEVFYVDMASDYTKENYPLWIRLLQNGKRVYVCAGCDKHAVGTDRALTTIYAKPSDTVSHALLPVLRTGDFTCGSVSLRMLLGDTVTGGHTVFDGQKLTVAVGDFHCGVRADGHTYALDVFGGEGLLARIPVTDDKTAYFTFAVDSNAPYYRAEVWDLTAGYRIALGNPIWNDRK